MGQKMPKSAESVKKAGFHSIGATIRTRRESRCLPYAGFSSNRPTGPIRSSSRDVHCMCVCVCVCLFVDFLRYCLNIFMPPLPEVGCPKFLEIRNPWGKVMERSGLTFDNFCLEVV